MESETAHRFDGYEAYPLNLSFEESSLQYLHSELEKRLPSLFVTESSKCSVEVLEAIYAPNTCHVADMEEPDSAANLRPASQPTLLANFLSMLNELKDTLQKELPPGSVRLLFIHRSNSWSRMKITLEMFKTICTFDRITPRFLSIIFGLGRKTTSTDEHYMTCYHHFSISTETEDKEMNIKDQYKSQERSRQNQYESYDVCYNIRHFEQHRRDLDDPWSCRQSAIHQKFYFAKGHSKWIVVHPPLLFGEGLKYIHFNQIAHPMGLHLHYLTAGAANWKEYLDHISEKLAALDQKISFPKSLKDFDVDFSFSQQVHILRQKSSQARFVLDNTIATVASLKVLADSIAQIIDLPSAVADSFRGELENTSSELRRQLLTARRLLLLSQDIKSMNNDILRFRDQDLSYENGLNLTRIAQSDAVEKKVMVTLANNTAEDSRTMRIATIIAMFYLPANFIMTFFSSVLVEFSNTNSPPKGDTGVSMMYIHHEIWVAILAILVLDSLTFLPAIYWDRRGKRHTAASHSEPERSA